MMQAVDSYLAIRRAAGFQLRNTEYRLRNYARFAEQRGEAHVHAETAVAWSNLASSPAERKFPPQEAEFEVMADTGAVVTIMDMGYAFIFVTKAL